MIAGRRHVDEKISENGTVIGIGMIGLIKADDINCAADPSEGVSTVHTMTITIVLQMALFFKNKPPFFTCR